MSALNAPYVLPRAAGMALLARDATHARLALERMVATGAHGRAIDMDRTAIRAGLAALDGSTQEAIAGFRAAIAGWRDLGLPWDEAMTSLDIRAARRDGFAGGARRRRGGTLDPRRGSGRGEWSRSSTGRCVGRTRAGAAPETESAGRGRARQAAPTSG